MNFRLLGRALGRRLIAKKGSLSHGQAAMAGRESPLTSLMSAVTLRCLDCSFAPKDTLSAPVARHLRTMRNETSQKRQHCSMNLSGAGEFKPDFRDVTTRSFAIWTQCAIGGH